MVKKAVIGGGRKFTGFARGALRFFDDLAANNNKAWFASHKADFQELIQRPMLDLAEDISPAMLAIDPHIQAGPRAVSRIYRDTRFSKDKSPYRTCMWLAFKRPEKEWTDSPAYYFEISPTGYRYGMGYYSASPATMRTFRDALDADPAGFLKAISFFSGRGAFRLEGEMYRKNIGPDKSPRIQEWYQRKNFYLICERKNGPEVYNGKLRDTLMEGFTAVAPLYKYLLMIKSGGKG